MEQIVTMDRRGTDTLITEIDYNDINYPGYMIPEMDGNQINVIRNTKKLNIVEEDDENIPIIKSNHSTFSTNSIKSTQSNESNESQDNDEKEEEMDKIDSQLYKHIEPKHIDTFTTPNIFSNINNQQIIEELHKEIKDLRQKVAKTKAMESFLFLLDDRIDTTKEIQYIINYSEKKFKLQLTSTDFESLNSDEILNIYSRVKKIGEGERYTFLYKAIFDFAVSNLQYGINKFAFKLDGLENVLMFDDISSEINQLMGNIGTRTIGKYLDTGSPISKLLFMLISKIVEAKLKT